MKKFLPLLPLLLLVSCSSSPLINPFSADHADYGRSIDLSSFVSGYCTYSTIPLFRLGSSWKHKPTSSDELVIQGRTKGSIGTFHFGSTRYSSYRWDGLVSSVDGSSSLSIKTTFEYGVAGFEEMINTKVVGDTDTSFNVVKFGPSLSELPFRYMTINKKSDPLFPITCYAVTDPALGKKQANPQRASLEIMSYHPQRLQFIDHDNVLIAELNGDSFFIQAKLPAETRKILDEAFGISVGLHRLASELTLASR